MKKSEFIRLICSTFRGVVIRPKVLEYRPMFYITSLNTLVFYDEYFTPQQILEMKYEVFNITVDQNIDEHLYDSCKPKDYIKHIFIKRGKEPYAISNILLNAQEDTDSYEDKLRCTTSSVWDRYEEQNKNKWRI